MANRKKNVSNHRRSSPKDTAVEELQASRLGPFSTKGSSKTKKAKVHNYRMDVPRRISEIPGMIGGVGLQTSMDDVADCLTVGRNIAISGEITACAKLIVEGRVEATINDAQVVSVSDGGFFKGTAECEAADIKGQFEGHLVAKQVLTVRTGGQVKGSVRYGRINIEPGGEISGEMEAIEDDQ